MFLVNTLLPEEPGGAEGLDFDCLVLGWSLTDAGLECVFLPPVFLFDSSVVAVAVVVAWEGSQGATMDLTQ